MTPAMISQAASRAYVRVANGGLEARIAIRYQLDDNVWLSWELSGISLLGTRLSPLKQTREKTRWLRTVGFHLYGATRSER